MCLTAYVTFLCAYQEQSAVQQVYYVTFGLKSANGEVFFIQFEIFIPHKLYK